MNPVDIRLPVESPPGWVGKPVDGPGATETTILRVCKRFDVALYWTCAAGSKCEGSCGEASPAMTLLNCRCKSRSFEVLMIAAYALAI